MSLEQQVTALVEASNNLTSAVNGKIGQIDQRMTAAENDFEQWKATTSYVQAYSLVAVEGSKESDKNTGNYYLVRLYTVRDAYKAQHPWIHLGWTGINQVGAGHFCSMAQSHAGFTGQSAMWVKRGACDVKFFIDRTNQSNAPVYMAIKNESWNNANVHINIASYMALDVASLGPVDLPTWLGDNSNLVEIETVDITTQPAPGA